MGPASKALTQRAYAKHRGVRLAAVQKAIDSGRLAKSLKRDAAGRVTSIDAAVADAEWEANTDSALAPAASGAGSNQFQTARAARESTRSEIDALKLAKLRGELVDAAEVKRGITDMVTRCRTKLLGIPSRARQQLPHLSAADVGTLEALVREALEDLAEVG